MRLFLLLVILLTSHYIGWGQCDVFPNPVADVVILKCVSESVVSYELFNEVGVRVLGVHGNTLETGSVVQKDVSFLTHGIYVFVFYEGDKVISTIPIIKTDMAEVEKKQKH
jgi:hypothetical protein